MENFIWLVVSKTDLVRVHQNGSGELPEGENSTFTKQMPMRRFEVSTTEYKQLDDLPFPFSSGKSC